MRKLILSLFFSLMWLINYAAIIPYSYTFHTEGVSVKDLSEDGKTYSQICSNVENYGEPGNPLLPCKCVTFALPINASDIQIKNSYLMEGPTIMLENKIAPAMEDITTNLDVVPREFGKIYDQDTPYPNLNVEIVRNESYVGFCRLVTVSICCAKYMPTADKLTLYSDIKFDLAYETNCDIAVDYNPINDDIFKKGTSQNLNYIRKIIANPDILDSLVALNYEYFDYDSDPVMASASGLTAYEYTIVTSRDMSNAFNRLVALKRVQGINAGIVCIEDILSNPAYANGDPISGINDDAGKLKAFLWANRRVIDFVLLGGKPPIVPMRYGWASATNIYAHDKYVPTDLYFGTDANSNWNYYNDPDLYGKWHDGFGFSSFFKIGRLLCKNEEDVNNYLNKLEIYEHNPGFGDYQYLNKSYTHISNDIVTHAPTLNDSVNNQLSQFFSTHDITVSNAAHYYHGAEIIENLNNTNYLIFDLEGHGNPGEVSTYDRGEDQSPYGISALDNEIAYQLVEESNGLDNLHNFGYPNVIYTTTCTSMPYDCPKLNNYGLFDHDVYNALSMNVAESFTLGKNYGGIAYLGNTRYGYTSKSKSMEKQFFKYINSLDNDTPISIGDAENISRLGISYSTNTAKHVLFGHNIVGDPSILLNRLNRINPNIEVIENRSANSISLSIWNQGYHPFPEPNVTKSAVFVEPDGTYHNVTTTGSTINISNISPYSVAYVKEYDKLPYIGDLNVPGAVAFGSDLYLYVNHATLGDNVGGNRNNLVNISNVNNLTIDAKSTVIINSDVTLNHSDIVIYTPDVCELNGVTVRPGSTLRIHAGSVFSTVSIANELADGRIVLYGYDKFFDSEDLISQMPEKQQQENSDYIPLLETGKRWVYNDIMIGVLHIPNYHIDAPIERLSEFKIGEKRQIDGIDYYPLIVTPDDYSNMPSDGSVELALLWENKDTRQVWAKLYKDIMYPNCQLWHIFTTYEDKVVLLYDFLQPENGTLMANQEYLDYSDCHEFDMTFMDGVHHAWTMPKDYAIVEGIGIFGLNNNLKGCSACNLLGEYVSEVPSLPVVDRFPYLYEVYGADGELIYHNDFYAPGCTSRIDAAVDADAIRYDGKEISIRSAAKGVARIYNVQGAAVGEYAVNADTYIPTSALASGIYFVSYNGQTLKISVK